MLEILPIKLLSTDDALIFGRLNVELGRLLRFNYPIADGFVITAPAFKLQTALNHFLSGNKELIEQSLLLVKKELEKHPVPMELISETKKKKTFFSEGNSFSDVEQLWKYLINTWIDEIKQKIWVTGFSPEITKNLTPQVITFIEQASAFGEAFFDEITSEVVINVKKGELLPKNQKELSDLILSVNKKLLLHHSYQWVLDKEIELVGVNLYTPDHDQILIKKSPHEIVSIATDTKRKVGVTKVLLDLSTGFVIEKNVDGAFFAAEKIINLDKKDESFEELIFKLTETATSLRDLPILFKLPDIPETLGGVRGTLRLLHQESLFSPLVKIIKFLTNEKKLENIRLVMPFLRHSSEYSLLKQKLAAEGINRNHNLLFWIEITVAENLLNIDEYLSVGVDGVVINVDELVGSLYGFNHAEEQFAYLKKETSGLTKFLGESILKLKRLKIPVIIYGSLVYDVSLLEFLVHTGVSGIIVERHEALSMNDLLYKIEKKVALKRIKIN